MKAVRVAIAIGIAVLLPLLAQMTVRFWAEPPDSSAYYNYYPPQPKNTEERATAEKETRERNAKYEKAMAAYSLIDFYVTYPIGIAELFLGFLLRRKTTLAGGFLFGGLSTVACGSYVSWEILPGWARYSSLLFVLLLLVVLALLVDRERVAEELSPS